MSIKFDGLVDRLMEAWPDDATYGYTKAAMRAVLVAERHAIVERLRERLKSADGPTEFQGAVWYSEVAAILDEEAS